LYRWSITIAAIKNTIINRGWKIARTSMTVRARKKPNAAKLLSYGTIKSNRETSFENLARILPTGFESKNNIFDLANFVSILLCIFILLVRIILKIAKLRKKEKSM